MAAIKTIGVLALADTDVRNQYRHHPVVVAYPPIHLHRSSFDTVAQKSKAAIGDGKETIVGSLHLIARMEIGQSVAEIIHLRRRRRRLLVRGTRRASPRGPGRLPPIGFGTHVGPGLPCRPRMRGGIREGPGLIRGSEVRVGTGIGSEGVYGLLCTEDTIDLEIGLEIGPGKILGIEGSRSRGTRTETGIEDMGTGGGKMACLVLEFHLLAFQAVFIHVMHKYAD